MHTPCLGPIPLQGIISSNKIELENKTNYSNIIRSNYIIVVSNYSNIIRSKPPENIKLFAPHIFHRNPFS